MSTGSKELARRHISALGFSSEKVKKTGLVPVGISTWSALRGQTVDPEAMPLTFRYSPNYRMSKC
jgi:hypothetical protein